jgi:hypothetical protein
MGGRGRSRAAGQVGHLVFVVLLFALRFVRASHGCCLVERVSCVRALEAHSECVLLNPLFLAAVPIGGVHSRPILSGSRAFQVRFGCFTFF